MNDHILCPTCGEKNEPERTFCWVCYAPFGEGKASSGQESSVSASQFLAQEEVRRNIACYEGRESQSDRVAMLSLWMGILSLILREIHSFTLSHVSGLGSLILTMLVGLFCMIFVPLISLVGVGTGLVGLFSQRRVYKAVALTGFLINILPLIFTARVLRALPTGSLKAAVEIGSFTKRVGKNLLGQF